MTGATGRRRRRYAVCGLSNRGLSVFVRPLLGHSSAVADVRDDGELVAIVDADSERVAGFRADTGYVLDPSEVPVYRPDQVDRMVAERQPDRLLVAPPDHAHADYLLGGLDHGLDVVTEKPMVTTAAAARRVLDIERRSAGTVRVTHNLRYAPFHRTLKSMIVDGRIGRPVSVELVWNVETLHGASYFWRWNRTRAGSGGLSVHKSCHHLDLVSWLLDDEPVRVFAFGARNFFGADSPHRPRRPDGAALPQGDEIDADPYLARWTAEERRPTLRPGRFHYDDEIDIEDTYSAVVGYRGGASLAYSVSFSAPWEGYRLAVNGTHGRLEAAVTFTGPTGASGLGQSLRWYPMFGPAEDVPVGDAGASGHLGADAPMVRELFTGDAEESVALGAPASAYDGALAVATGEAIWRSAVEGGRAYDIA
ncbi:MAG TPA: Gfo/Idh/MocA family oxidoreductase, partial [Actinopolymorphaceae bacterium]